MSNLRLEVMAEHLRRVVYKAEAMEQGTNTRFLVTTRDDKPEDLYGLYARRGESENWIKDLKLALKADRLSCHRFMANQFRLLLHAAAYWLMDALRRRLVGVGLERMQLDTLRRSVCTLLGGILDKVHGTLFRGPSEVLMNNPG